MKHARASSEWRTTNTTNDAYLIYWVLGQNGCFPPSIMVDLLAERPLDMQKQWKQKWSEFFKVTSGYPLTQWVRNPSQNGDSSFIFPFYPISFPQVATPLVLDVLLKPYHEGMAISSHSLHTESMNASHSTNLFTNSCDHIFTNGKAPLHSHINHNNPQFLCSLWRRANARNVSFPNLSRW